MITSYTLKLWDHLLKEEFSSFDKAVHKILNETHLGPKKETIDSLLAYASSVKVIKTKSKDKFLISLN
jgi:hypothetical protein